MYADNFTANQYAGLSTVQNGATDLNTNRFSNNIVQLEVFKSDAKWGITKDKWYTSFDPVDARRYFDSQQEAQEAEEALLQAKEEATEQAWHDASWIFRDSASKHFGDGWGELYGITSLGELEEAIEQNGGDDEEGNYRIDLGKHGHGGQYIMKTCTIVYEVSYEEVNIEGDSNEIKVRDVFHCGPSDQK